MHVMRPRCAKRVSAAIEAAEIPPRGSDQSRKAIRVKIPLGSFNACQSARGARTWRHVRPGQDKTRGPLEKSGRE